MTLVRSSTPSYTTSRAVALGGYCPTTSRPARRSFILEDLAFGRDLGEGAPSGAARLRVRLRRDPQPDAGVVASQAAKFTDVYNMGGEERSYGRCKNIRGQKRHLLVNTQCLVLGAKVYSAGLAGRDRIKSLLGCAKDQFRLF